MGSDIIILAESDISQRKNFLPLVKKKVLCLLLLLEYRFSEITAATPQITGHKSNERRHHHRMHSSQSAVDRLLGLHSGCSSQNMGKA